MAKPTIFSVDASEKLYADYQLTVTNPGGHSSLPVPDNAIYELADGLERLAHYEFPFELNGVTRAYFETESKIMSGQTADRHARHPEDTARPRMPSSGSTSHPSTTPPCALPASPRGSMPVTPTTRCPSAPRPS